MKNPLSLLSLCLLAALNVAGAHDSATRPPTTATLEDFKLLGDLSGDRASFTLTATAHVENPKGGSLALLAGNVALIELMPHPKWQLHAEQNRFTLSFPRAGKFPIQIKFNAAVHQT